MSRIVTPSLRTLEQFKNTLMEAVKAVSKVISNPNAQESVDFAKETSVPINVASKVEKIDLAAGSSHISAKEFAKKDESELEKAIQEWADGGTQVPSKREKANQVTKGIINAQKSALNKTAIETKSRFLVKSISQATSSSSQLLRLQELCKHLLIYPESKGILVQEKAIRLVLNLRQYSDNENVISQSREALALLGYTDPPGGNGIRILSIDGGGTRGIMAIEMIRKLEAQTGKRVHELFDLICGVSTGAILTMLFGGLLMSLDECEVLYRKLSCDIFKQNPWWGTGKLVWSHSYYDTNLWVNVLRKTYGEERLIEVTKRKNNPKVAVMSAIMNQPTLQAYMFRSYSLPYPLQSNYLGGCNHKAWEAIRASAAAPGYFEDFCLDGLIHQDGGLLWNNPTALAIHEAKLLWPKEELACVVSLGTGRFIPAAKPPDGATSTNLKTKVLKILDSATDTEGVHSMLHDLLPPSVYFRFNPYLRELITMDENRPEKLELLKEDAQMYLRKNELKTKHAANALARPRSKTKRIVDFVRLQKDLRF